ncbi:MAG: AMP-binding protein, partial [Alphaproteobacteria bacterium]|nr:AMP-binding protein [Alphaproteobacteria bacterium]
RFALALLDLGVGPGDVVSLLLPNWWQFNVVHMACVRIGAITNPLMPIFREGQLIFMLGFAETKVLIAPETYRGFDYRPMVDGMRPELPKLAHAFYIGGVGDDAFEAHFLAQARETADDAEARLAGLRPGSNDVIEIIYTSGTTGQPKGVMHTANTLFCHLYPLNEHLALTGDDVFQMSSPLAHQTGFIWGVLISTMLGTTVVLQDRWEPVKGAELIERHRVTYTMASTPFLNDLASVAEPGRFDLSSLRYFIAAGAPIPPALVERAQAQVGMKVLSGWGMSECALATVCRPSDPPEKIFGTDGLVLDCNGVKVVDGDGNEAPVNTEGLLLVTGAAQFVGYLKRPDLHGTDADGWFDTGDLAYMDADGYIRITGRAKDIIIRGGENIPVVEVESCIFRHPAVEDVAVVGMPDERLGERGCAYVTLNQGHDLTFTQLIAYLDEEKMTKQYLPERLEILDAFPRTPSGKIQKFVLRDWAKELAAGG